MTSDELGRLVIEGKLIAKYRKRKGLSQAEVTTALSVKRSAISNVEMVSGIPRAT